MIISEISSINSQPVNALVSEAFQYQAPHTFFDDFPIWASDQVVRLGIHEGSALMSHVGYRLAEIRTSTGLQKIALIGAVATRASHRGKGLSTQLLKETLSRIETSGYKWSVLWGSEHEFYAKLGFELSGKQCRAPLAKLSFSPKELVNSEIKGGLNEETLKALFHARNGIVLGEQDRNWLSAHKTVRWFSIEKPFAYVAFERGMDLHHIIHEAGGDTRSLEKLMFHVYSLDPAAEIMGTTDALQKLGFQNQDLTEEYLCLARATQKEASWPDDFWISGISAC